MRADGNKIWQIDGHRVGHACWCTGGGLDVGLCAEAQVSDARLSELGIGCCPVLGEIGVVACAF